jgi:hypothetical protein
MTNVIVARKTNINVNVNSTAGIIQPTSPVNIQNVPTINTGKTRIDEMDDVLPEGEVEGASLVYDSAIDKYIVKKINLADVVGDLDGGEF